MKKKVLAIVLICLYLMASRAAYASDYGIMPCYNVVSMANCAIASESDGVLMNIWVCAPDSTSLDKVSVTVKLKRSSGATAATITKNAAKQGNVFYFDETEDVTVSGTYHFEYTAKCYKNNVLVDTVTGTSASISHTV